MQPTEHTVDHLMNRIERLNEIGRALSADGDTEHLVEHILLGAKELTHADGGTLYLVEDGVLRFRVVRNDTLGIALGGTSGNPVDFPDLPLYGADGTPNHANVAAYAALTGEPVNVADAYAAEGFDFSGTRKVDASTGYHSKSFLTIPLSNHEGEVIGVLQLINALSEGGGVVAFSDEDQRLAESLASQAAVALTQQQLIDAQRELFESFIQLIAKAIDEKSKHTSGHCQRVPELTMLIANAVNGEGPLAEQPLSQQELYELRIAAWLHDCGKVTTPEPVMDKETKLHALHDRIEDVATRVEVVKRDTENAALREQLAAAREGRPAAEWAGEEAVAERLSALDEVVGFLRRANTGGEFMDPEDQQRIAALAAAYSWTDDQGRERPLLSEEEVYALQVAKGTLTPEEREVMKDHMRVTIDMLEALPYPRHLQRVPQLAGGHHERMDGQGYPKGLEGYENPAGARMMAIADVFEALTAVDRPYKQPMQVSQALTILGRMTDEGHIDPDLFDLFVRKEVYADYARQFLRPEQNDADQVDLAALPGFAP